MMEDQEQLFSIQEVSLKLKIPKHTLRFWEKEFKDILVPLRTVGGQRRYTVKHLSIIKKVKKLREEGASLTEVNRTLNNTLNGKRSFTDSETIDFLADRVAEAVRVEVYRFFNTDRKEMRRQ